jgi:hypothetical protein
VTYLNHGSFGPTPKVVMEARQAWSERVASEPMDFLIRQMESYLDEAAEKLGKFVGCEGRDLLFVDNATVGMNIVVENTPLEPGDEALACDQEYGAVLRICACLSKTGAKLVVRPLPSPITSAEDVTEALLSGITNRTKLIVVVMSLAHRNGAAGRTHLSKARERKIPVCIDGPHAIACDRCNSRSSIATSTRRAVSRGFGSNRQRLSVRCPTPATETRTFHHKLGRQPQRSPRELEGRVHLGRDARPGGVSFGSCGDQLSGILRHRKVS